MLIVDEVIIDEVIIVVETKEIVNEKLNQLDLLQRCEVVNSLKTGI